MVDPRLSSWRGPWLHENIGVGEAHRPAIGFPPERDRPGVPSRGRDQRTAMRPILESAREPFSKGGPSAAGRGGDALVASAPMKAGGSPASRPP
jgi:hypothetical protein